MSITEIAYASGFGSLRRFNAVFRSRYRLCPGDLRRNPDRSLSGTKESPVLLLSYCPPYNWVAMLDFLKLRVLKAVDGSRYTRTVSLGKHKERIQIMQASSKHALRVEVSHSLTPVLPALLRRVRNLFDLDAHPQLIADHLQQDALLQKSLNVHPGLRVPGAFGGFEMLVRAVSGQQITVKTATTAGGCFAAAFGEPLGTLFPGLTSLSPEPAREAEATVDEIANLGIVRVRASTILNMAGACSRSMLPLEPVLDPPDAIAQLTAQSGIGEWIAHYIAMRWPDAFPKEDVVIRKNPGGLSADEAEERSLSWRPWCSYAVMHIWKNLPLGKNE